MGRLKVTLARIEAFENGELGKRIRVVFHIERGAIDFFVPIHLQGRDFDDTEVIQAARNALYQMFEELARHSKAWELSPAELEHLSEMNLRPVE